MASNDTEKNKINKWKSDSMINTENMLDISEIRWNTLILKDWGLRWIIRVFWLNLDLKNSEEQEIVVEQYKKFLNWLEFPVQILIRNTYLDLTDYIKYMDAKVNSLKNDVLKRQGQQYVNFLEDINARQWLIYTKEFYIVVPYYQDWDETENISKPWWRKFLDALDNKETPEKIVARYRTLIKNRNNLDARCNQVMNALQGMGVFCERLGLVDIISLLFKVYNPLAHKDQSEYKEK